MFFSRYFLLTNVMNFSSKYFHAVFLSLKLMLFQKHTFLGRYKYLFDPLYILKYITYSVDMSLFTSMQAILSRTSCTVILLWQNFLEDFRPPVFIQILRLKNTSTSKSCGRNRCLRNIFNVFSKSFQLAFVLFLLFG